MPARILTYRASAQDAGRAVRDIMRQEFHLVAHDAARAKYRTEKGITVNGEVSLVNRILKEGDVVRIRLEGERPEKTVPAEGPLEILYEDEDVICLNKPAGLVVHPSHGHFADTLGNYLAWYYLQKQEPHEVRTIGRLDKDTSGVIAFGKSRTACAILAGQTGEGALAKEYLALASGVFSAGEGQIEAPISREFEEKIRRVVREDGDYAITWYRVLRQFARFALLSVRIGTGRTHQIRVHMAHIGHPLLGDPVYGGEARLACDGVPDMKRAALHAFRLSFRQPFTGEEIRIAARLPGDMRSVLLAAGAPEEEADMAGAPGEEADMAGAPEGRRKRTCREIPEEGRKKTCREA